MRVLVIEDDIDVADNVYQYLEQRGHMVDVATDGRSGLRKSEEDSYDAIVLDLTLPHMDGLQVCRALRTSKASPAILILTARDSVEDKLEGFESGADDYLVKPFALAELEARLRVISERSVRSARELCVGGLSLNVENLEVRRDGVIVHTTPAERRVLELLMRYAHRVVTRFEIEQMLWPDEVPKSDALRTHIHGLRKAIDKPGAVSMIRTIKLEGYRLVAE